MHLYRSSGRRSGQPDDAQSWRRQPHGIRASGRLRGVGRSTGGWPDHRHMAMGFQCLVTASSHCGGNDIAAGVRSDGSSDALSGSRFIFRVRQYGQYPIIHKAEALPRSSLRIIVDAGDNGRLFQEKSAGQSIIGFALADGGFSASSPSPSSSHYLSSSQSSHNSR